MSIQVALVEDQIRKDGSIVPRVLGRSTVSFDKLLEFMAKDTGLSANDMRSTFTQFVNALVFYLPEGDRVQTPLGTFTLRLRSSGSDPTQREVQPDGAQLRLRAGHPLLARLRLATTVEIVDTPTLQLPVVRRIANADAIGTPTEGLPGHILHIEGSRLSFDSADAELGVFFVAADGATAVRAVVYSRVGSTTVDCKIPEMAAGGYTLEIRTRPTDTDVRVGAYKGVFAVLQA